MTNQFMPSRTIHCALLLVMLHNRSLPSSSNFYFEDDEKSKNQHNRNTKVAPVLGSGEVKIGESRRSLIDHLALKLNLIKPSLNRSSSSLIVKIIQPISVSVYIVVVKAWPEIFLRQEKKKFILVNYSSIALVASPVSTTISSISSE